MYIKSGIKLWRHYAITFHCTVADFQKTLFKIVQQRRPLYEQGNPNPICLTQPWLKTGITERKPSEQSSLLTCQNDSFYPAASTISPLRRLPSARGLNHGMPGCCHDNDSFFGLSNQTRRFRSEVTSRRALHLWSREIFLKHFSVYTKCHTWKTQEWSKYSDKVYGSV